jgi:hypothetical protein
MPLELTYSTAWRILPEVYFIYNLVACPFGEFIFLTHVFVGIRFWELGVGEIGRREIGRRGMGDYRMNCLIRKSET